MIFDTNTLENLEKLAKHIKLLVKKPFVIHLNGDLGAGKTTFVKTLASLYGLKQNVTSPTYSLMDIHKNEHINLIHMDMYRIKNELEIDMLAIDYLPSDSIICIEWPFLSNKTPKPNIILNFNTQNNQRQCQIQIT
jgi:tRNA threonylcarbamoyladenosine biosynthesis protein TsaE